MTDEQQRMIRLLNRCTFGVGSNEKRFVADMARTLAVDSDAELSVRQDWYLRRTFYRYRVQVGDVQMPKPVDFDAPPAKPVKLFSGVLGLSRSERRQKREQDRLTAWNAGKPK